MSSAAAVQRLNCHVQRIFQAMAPDIGAWRVIGIVEGKGKCACGHHIEVACFALKKPNDDRTVLIGPTCIDETIPFLARMTSHERAHAMEVEWREHLQEFRRQLSLREGTSKLMSILPVAAAMDEWFEAMKQRFTDAGSKLQPYFFQRRNRRLGELGLGRANGDRAKNIANHLAGFRDHLPLLRKAAVAAKIEWTEAPTCFDVSQDWFEARLEVESTRARLMKLVSIKDLTRPDREMLVGILPSKLSQLKAWLDWAKGFESSLAEYPKLRAEMQRRLSAADHEDLPELAKLSGSYFPDAEERISAWLARVRKLLLQAPDAETIRERAAQAKAERERIAEARRQEDVRRREERARHELERVRAEQVRREELRRAEQARYEAWKRQEAERLQAEQARREEQRRQEAERLAAQKAQRRQDLEKEIAELHQEYKRRSDRACYRLTFRSTKDARGRSQFEAQSSDGRIVYVLQHVDSERVSVDEICLCSQERYLVDTNDRRVVLVALQANATRFDRLVASLESELKSLRD